MSAWGLAGLRLTPGYGVLGLDGTPDSCPSQKRPAVAASGRFAISAKSEWGWALWKSGSVADVYRHFQHCLTVQCFSRARKGVAWGSGP